MTISIPDTLTTDNSENYIVSIRLRSGGLSFSGYDPSVGGSFFYLETEFDRAVSFISSLKEFFFAHEFLTWTYKRIHVVYVSPQYTLVHRDYFREDKKRELLDFAFSVPETFCLSDTLEGQETELVFGVDEEVYEFCSRSLLHPSFSHYMTPLLGLWRRQSDAGTSRQMFVVVDRKQMDVACYDRERLLFVNTFPIDQLNDRLYYILYVWKQIGLDPQKDSLRLLAEPSLKTPLVDNLQVYVRHIEPMEIPSEAYLRGADIVKAPMDLISLSICE